VSLDSFTILSFEAQPASDRVSYVGRNSFFSQSNATYLTNQSSDYNIMEIGAWSPSPVVLYFIEG